MRTLTYGGAVSLDGFLAGPGGALDWLHFSRDVQAITRESFVGVDTILMGRKTFVPVAASYAAGKAQGAAPGASTMRTIVFSRTLTAADAPGVELVGGDAVAFVRDLKQQPGGGIVLMGGGELAASLLAADLVDRVGLNVHPILLGAGVPAFPDPGRRTALTLSECRPIDGGCILAIYEVNHLP